MNETEIYFRSLYGERPNGWLWVGAFGAQGGAIGGRFVQSTQEAASHALTLDSGGHKGVYHSLATYAEIPAERGSRGTRDEVGAVYAFALDADLAGPGHKDKKLPYPNTRDEVSELVQAAGMPEPTTWVFSGGGYYPQWVLDEPIIIDSPERRAEVTGWYTGLSKRIIGVFASRGYQLDSTFDLARVYRVPGTTNRKTDTPVMCAVWSTGGGTVAEAKLRNLSTPAREENGENEVRARAAPAFADPFVTGDQIKAPARSSATDLVRVFTPEAAERYRAKLDAMFLRDGEEIGWNNAINRYGFAMARMVAFWSRDEVAEHMLALLTPVTGWTALDENDERTLNSGYDGFARSGQPLGEVAPVGLPEPAGTPQGRLRGALLKRSQIHLLPDPVPLIRDVLYTESVMVLSGKFGTYKSFVAVAMACSLASGRDWMGHEVPRAVPVIYAAAEGAYGIKKRIDAWERKYGDVPDDLMLIPLAVRLNSAQDMAELGEIVHESGAKVLIFDTLHASTPGVDENDSGEMGLVMDTLRSLRDKHQVTSILPHHTGHGGARARGSSSIEDDADISFVIELDGEDRGPAGKRVMRHRKTKDDALLPPVTLELELVEGTGSGYVRGQDEYEAASGHEEAPAVGQAVMLREPEQWLYELTHNRAAVQRQVLQTLHQVGQTVGLTQAQCRKLVLDRWYPAGEGRGKEALSPATWGAAWTGVQELEKAPTEGVQSEPVIIKSGERLIVSEVFRGLSPFTDD